MVNKSVSEPFVPVVAMPPGETIRENMQHLGMKQKELAVRLGMSTKHLSNIINGKEPITYETALKLETVIGPTAQFWMNLETNYQLQKARLENEDGETKELELLKEIPYKSMSEHGWVPNTRERRKRLENLYHFFGVTSLQAVEPAVHAMFRQQKAIKNVSDFGVLAWLRKAELEGLSVEVDGFNRAKLRRLIPHFRSLTLQEPDVFYPEMQRLCAECGVALVLVPALPKTCVCGATLWRRGRAILALSVRGKRADIFWFTFFHELAHLIDHTKKQSSISYENDASEEEKKADAMASHILIPDREYQAFLSNENYADGAKIQAFAERLGIAPCIVVGRLLHDQLVDFAAYSSMRSSFEILN